MRSKEGSYELSELLSASVGEPPVRNIEDIEALAKAERRVDRALRTV